MARTPPLPDEIGRRLIHIARIGRIHGLRGELRVEPIGPGDALRHAAWLLVGCSPIDARRMRIEDLRGHAGRMLLKLEGIDDPDAARAQTGSRVYLRRSDFPPAEDGEYYLTDLVGLRVRIADGGAPLGFVDEVLSTPAFDILLVRGEEGGEERLVPFTRAALREVRLQEGEVLVNPPEAWEEREGSPSRGQARRGRGHARPHRGKGPEGD